MKDLTNKTAVITGGSSGIGLALAKAAGLKGARVIIAEPQRDRLETAAKILTELGIDAKHFACDVTQLEQVEALADFAWQENEQVDLVINNAGIGQPRGTILDADIADIRATFDVNFYGVWHGCRVFGKRFIEQGRPAAIYNTGSENSLFNAAPGIGGYIASKHAVLGLTEVLREELPDHITVGMIVPGFVASNLTRGVAHLAMDADQFAEIILQQIQDGRFYAVSHAYNMEHINARYQEIQESYAQYAPRYDGDDEYDVRTLRKQL